MVVLFLCVAQSFGQSKHTYEYQDFLYERETSFGFNINTRGGLPGGIVFKHTRAVTSRWFDSFGLEFAGIHHPQEETHNTNRGNSFIRGKTRHLFVLRALYGREFIFFKKADKNGVQLTINASAGPSIGLSPPYYIKYYRESRTVFGNQIYVASVEAYDPNTHQLSSIFDSADLDKLVSSLFTESKIQIGLYVKLGLIFDVSPFLTSVTGFELGLAADLYPKEIEIMSNTNNTNFFPNLYLNILFGRRILPEE